MIPSYNKVNKSAKGAVVMKTTQIKTELNKIKAFFLNETIFLQQCVCFVK